MTALATSHHDAGSPQDWARLIAVGEAAVLLNVNEGHLRRELPDASLIPESRSVHSRRPMVGKLSGSFAGRSISGFA